MEEQEKDAITVVSSTNNEIVRESNEFVFSNTGLSEIQMNMFVRALTKFDIDPEKIDLERRYMVEFQRSEIPHVSGRKERIIEQLEALQDIKAKRILPNGGWEKLIPFPKIGKYENGTIKIWFDGEYLKPIMEQKKGYAVFHIAEMFSLNGLYPKRLFEMFCSYKNRSTKRFEIEISVLKEILGAEDKYKDNHGVFFKRVLAPAIDQINEKTSIKVNAAYRKRKKGRNPAMFIFDIERKDKRVSTAPVPDKQTKELPGKEYNPNYEDERQVRCYERMTDWGFTPKQARNCAENEKTMSLFFKWKGNSGIDSHIRDGKMTKEEAKKMFFGELKKNSLRI